MSLKKKVKRIRRKIRRRLERTWLWDKLFLDFYLDKRWTVRFRILNFLSGGALLDYVVTAYTFLIKAHEYDDSSEEERLFWIKIGHKKAEFWLREAMKEWER